MEPARVSGRHASVAAHENQPSQSPSHPQSTIRHPPTSASDAEVAPEQTAVRVQVAAVAAQQAALFEEEARLQQQQEALTQQQEQLAAHLEEKRQQVRQLADQVHAARAALKRDQLEHAQSSAHQAEELAKRQAESAEHTKKLHSARHRLRSLRRRLKKHYQLRKAAEDRQLRHREAAVSAQHRRIEKEAAKLQQERNQLTSVTLTFNGEIELGKRQLQAGRQKLELEQKSWQEQHERQQADLVAQARTLLQRENALADAARVFADAQHAWQLKRKVAEQEIHGLDSRILNQRRKLNEQQRDLEQLKRRLGCLQDGEAIDAEELPISDCQPRIEITSPPTPVENPQFALPLAEVIDLERLAEDLADQRLELVEHWHRLAVTRQDWEQAQRAAADSLDALCRGLPEREQALDARQAALEEAETTLRQRRQELSLMRQHLEGWGARLRLCETTWESERDCMLAELRGREETAEKHLAKLVDLRQSWVLRRRQELDLLATERAACENLRQEAAVLRQECWKSSLALDQQQRELAEKTLALEEYQQRFVLQSQDAAAVESKLERIRKRWAQHNASLMRATSEQLQHLQAEASHIQQRGRELLEVAEELTNRETDLVRRQSALEDSLIQAEVREISLRQSLETARTQRERCELQIADLQAEIERLALVMLDEAEEPRTSLNKAA